MTEETTEISLTVNGEQVTRTVPVRRHLVDFLRLDLNLTGSHLACEHGVCGACTIRVDGVVARGCLMLAVQANGADVVTIEGLSASGEVADLQREFETRNAAQCGFCTPGMVLTSAELLAQMTSGGGVPDREVIRDHLSGNLCRCTGYQAFIDAVDATAEARARIATGDSA
jgi:carbon-monoxide dehydrogenase small subunit